MAIDLKKLVNLEVLQDYITKTISLVKDNFAKRNQTITNIEIVNEIVSPDTEAKNYLKIYFVDHNDLDDLGQPVEHVQYNEIIIDLGGTKITEFVSGGDYEVDDMVIYDNHLYKCTTSPQADTTTFNSTEWTKIGVSSEAYTRTIDELLFTLNPVTNLYEYEFDNPFANTTIVCSLQDVNGKSLIETITTTDDKIKVTLVQPETVTINIVGNGVDSTIIEKKDNILYSETIDETSFILNASNNRYEYTLANPFGSANVVCSLQDVDGDSLVESINVNGTEIKVSLSAAETVTLNVIGDGINGSVVLKDALTQNQKDLLQLVNDKKNEITSLAIDTDSDLAYNNKKVLVGYGIETSDLDFSNF